MKTDYLFKLSLGIFLLIFASCVDDDYSLPEEAQDPNPTNPENFSEYFGSDIERDFLGKVLDENNNPISGVTISIGFDTAITDDNGVFIINDANVKERFAYVKAEKAGYINGSRSVAPSEGVNKVSIMLLEDNIVGTVNSGSSQTISLPNGSSVSFDGNFTDENGDSYSGAVDVIMHHLDPADEDMRLQMPGMLYAENQDGAERMLQTFGMLAVELRGSGGEDLDLAEGSTAEIKMPLDASLLSTAPSTIPLWYFDEENGYWKEEGQATLQGNAYVGEVSHFSFWNCDIPAEANIICINISDEDSNPLANLSISITSENFGTTYGITNANGVVCGYLPSGESLDLNVFNNDLCGDAAIYNETIGPFTSDDVVNITLIPPSNIIEETVTGTFNACDGTLVDNGYVQLNYQGITYQDYVDDGNFEITFLRCTDDTSFSIEGIDYDNIQTTGEINFTFTTPSTNVGTISACNTVTEFVFINVGSVYDLNLANEFQVSAVNGQSFNNTVVQITDFQGDQCLYLYGVVNTTNPLGSYNDGIDFNVPSDTGFSLNFEGCFPFDNTDNINYDVTAFGNPGEYIDINISGTVIDSLNVSQNVTGTIHVLRDQ